MTEEQEKDCREAYELRMSLLYGIDLEEIERSRRGLSYSSDTLIDHWNTWQAALSTVARVQEDADTELEQRWPNSETPPSVEALTKAIERLNVEWKRHDDQQYARITTLEATNAAQAEQLAAHCSVPTKPSHILQNFWGRQMQGFKFVRANGFSDSAAPLLQSSSPPEPCEDEGCPHHGIEHVCISLTPPEPQAGVEPHPFSCICNACCTIENAPKKVEPLPTSEESKLLGELLAHIHRDGGHHQEQVGTVKAFADAIEIVGRYKFDVEPQAGVELTPVAQGWWKYRFDGHGPRGYVIKTHSQMNEFRGDDIVFLGEGEHLSKAVHEICDLHNDVVMRLLKDRALNQRQAVKAEPCTINAWQHELRPAHVISDEVKELWLKVNPKHVEHYTVPLTIGTSSAAQGVPEAVKLAMIQAHSALESEYRVQTRATEAQRVANATCGQSPGGASGIALLAESGYISSLGKKNIAARDALFAALRDYPVISAAPEQAESKEGKS